MENKEIYWNSFALEDYLERLDELSSSQSVSTDMAVKEVIKQIPSTVRQHGYYDKKNGVRKINDLGETILYREHDTKIEIMGAFHERSDWTNKFKV